MIVRRGIILAAAGWLLPSAAPAQHQHFGDGWNWRERQSDHFTLRASGTDHDPARRYAEKVWEICLGVLPGLGPDFADNEWRTPRGAEGSDAAPFRFTVYLVGTGDAYRQLTARDAERNGWDANHVRSTHMTRNYADPHNRYYVLCKADPENSGGGGEQDLTAAFVHGTGAALLSGRARRSDLPFWMTAGFGYYVEHRLFELCRVHYLDFEAYYGDTNAEIKRGLTLGPDESWARVVRKLCKDGQRETLDAVCSAEILTLTPNRSGYIFALTCFLLRDEPAVAKYRELVAQARDGREVDKERLLATYGYADDGALEGAWYEWLEGRDFE